MGALGYSCRVDVIWESYMKFDIVNFVLCFGVAFTIMEVTNNIWLALLCIGFGMVTHILGFAEGLLKGRK